jgi:hypothetical protein
MPSIRLLKARDRFENNVKIAYAQEEIQKKLYHKYRKDAWRTLNRYKQWLKEKDIESSLNLDNFIKPDN